MMNDAGHHQRTGKPDLFVLLTAPL